MSTALQLLPLLIILVLYAMFFKLAARVLRVSRLGWSYAFQFAALVVAITIAIRLVTVFVGELPMLPGVLAGLGLHVALGAWFFRERALAPDGEPLGWGGGAKLTAAALGLLFLTLAILVAVVRVLRPYAGP